MAQDITDKITIYKKELENVIKQLSEKRTELYRLSKETIDRLNLSIPALREEERKSQDRILSLNKIIENKQIQANEKQKDFDKLTNDLKKSHEEIINEVLNRANKLEAQQKEFNTKSSELMFAYQEKLDELESNKQILSENIYKLQQEKTNFENKKSDFYAEINMHKDDLRQLGYSLESKEADIKSKNNKANENLEYANSQKNQCNVILNKLSEVEQRELSAKEKEDQNLKREEELNTLAVKLKADIVKLSNRIKEHDVKENILNERERNLKLLESKIGA